MSLNNNKCILRQINFGRLGLVSKIIVGKSIIYEKSRRNRQEKEEELLQVFLMQTDFKGGWGFGEGGVMMERCRLGFSLAKGFNLKPSSHLQTQ